MTIAMQAKAPEWMLENAEAKEVAEVASDIIEACGFKPSENDAKLLRGIMVLGAVYGTRAFLTIQRLKEEKATNVTPKAQAPAQSVSTFRSEFQQPVPVPEGTSDLDPGPATGSQDIGGAASPPSHGHELNKAIFPEHFK